MAGMVMGKLNYFNYCALAVMAVLLISVAARHMLKGRRNRYFWNLLLIVTCAVVLDIIAVHFDNSGGTYVLEKYVSHCAYLVMINLAVPVYVIYLACLTDSMYRLRDSIPLQLVLAAPYIVIFELIVTTPFTHLIFYIDDAYNYTRGSLYIWLYIVSAFYVSLGVVYALRCNRLFGRGQFLAMLAVFPIMLIALAVQVVHPAFRIEMFAHAIGILFLLFMVQKPEERTNPVTGYGRDFAYASDIEMAVRNQKAIRIILINVLNYKALRDILGYESMTTLMNRISSQILSLCKKNLPKVDPYYLDRGRFCLVVGKENFAQVENAADMISDMLKEDIILQGMNINLQVNVCIIKCPEDLNDFQSIYAFSNEFEEYERTGKVLTAEEILKDGRYIIKDIEEIIDNAMNKEGLTVYYQPIYSVKKKRFVSAEALLRLNDEEYGHISPELFIPVAEKNGVIHKIGSFVLEEVCRFIASEEYKQLGLEYIEVNLSVAQCMRSDLAKEITELLKKYHLRPDQINLEITETAASSSQNIMMENIRKLSEAGIPFSLDDFGTGYSNMRRMTTLPLALVKLDKTFTDLQDNPKLESVVRNSVQMIKDMDMKIVVEGIETEEMAKFFSDLQCDYIQGFYYSKPLTKDGFVEFVKKENMK